MSRGGTLVFVGRTPEVAVGLGSGVLVVGGEVGTGADVELGTGSVLVGPTVTGTGVGVGAIDDRVAGAAVLEGGTGVGMRFTGVFEAVRAGLGSFGIAVFVGGDGVFVFLMIGLGLGSIVGVGSIGTTTADSTVAVADAAGTKVTVSVRVGEAMGELPEKAPSAD